MAPRGRPEKFKAAPRERKEPREEEQEEAGGRGGGAPALFAGLKGSQMVQDGVGPKKAQLTQTSKSSPGPNLSPGPGLNPGVRDRVQARI